MKKRNTALLTVSVIIEAVRIITLPIAIIIIILMGMIVIDGSFIKRYHDIEIYTQQKYLDEEEFGERVVRTGGRAEKFFPEYENIEYNYSDIDFYIFDGVATVSYNAVTFALDLKFSDKDEYESAKQNELSTHTFMTEYEVEEGDKEPVFEFDLGDYSCKTVDGYDPDCFGLICLNDSDYVVRYLIFEQWEAPHGVKDAAYLLNCTNCPWNN